MALQQLQAGYEQYQPVKQSLSKAALLKLTGLQMRPRGMCAYVCVCVRPLSLTSTVVAFMPAGAGPIPAGQSAH
jgi:hypothetical protein